MTNWRLLLDPRRILSVTTALVGSALLLALAFSFNALFASRTQHLPHSAGQADSLVEQMTVVGYVKNGETGRAVETPDVTINGPSWQEACKSFSDGKFICGALVSPGQPLGIYVHDKEKDRAYARFLTGQPGKRIHIPDIFVF